MKICLLSTLNSYILGNMLKRFMESNIKIDSVLIDSKSPSKKELEIEKFRTEGKLENIFIDEYVKTIPVKHVENHCTDESIKCNSKNNYSDIIVRVFKKGFP